MRMMAIGSGVRAHAYAYTPAVATQLAMQGREAVLLGRQLCREHYGALPPGCCVVLVPTIPAAGPGEAHGVGAPRPVCLAPTGLAPGGPTKARHGMEAHPTMRRFGLGGLVRKRLFAGSAKPTARVSYHVFGGYVPLSPALLPA